MQGDHPRVIGESVIEVIWFFYILGELGESVGSLLGRSWFVVLAAIVENVIFPLGKQARA